MLNFVDHAIEGGLSDGAPLVRLAVLPPAPFNRAYASAACLFAFAVPSISFPRVFTGTLAPLLEIGARGGLSESG